jgi:hypothetical protein
MKVVAIGLSVVSALSACSGTANDAAYREVGTSVSQPSSTTSSTTTSTTVFKGSDCTKARVDEFGTKFPKESKTPEELVSNFTSYRSYVRRLDLPTIQREQDEFVDRLRDFISAANRGITTGGRDQSYRDAVIPVQDALEDFVYAFVRECFRG